LASPLHSGGEAFYIMKIVILRKSNQLGSTSNIKVKGMSSVRYNFVWDKQVSSFAYEPKNQEEIDDIFLTQGRIYRHMNFSIVLDEVESEKEEQKPKPKSRKKKQPVEKQLETA
jgi:hypothetical protein